MLREKYGSRFAADVSHPSEGAAPLAYTTSFADGAGLDSHVLNQRHPHITSVQAKKQMATDSSLSQARALLKTNPDPTLPDATPIPTLADVSLA